MIDQESSKFRFLHKIKNNYEPEEYLDLEEKIYNLIFPLNRVLGFEKMFEMVYKI